MRQRLTLLMVVAFVLSGCPGYGNTQSFTYALRKPQNERGYSTLHTMPDGALLVLIKPIEQPKQIWQLRRIVGWGTAQPREDELAIDVGPNDELWPPFESEEMDHTPQLLMDPGRNYLVVRFAPDTKSWNRHPEASAQSLRSVLNIIDLHTFKLLSRVVVTDPLLAAGDMGFSPNGTFVASGIQERTRAMIGDKVTLTARFAVETLTLPALQPAMVCSYTIVTQPFVAEGPATSAESRGIEAGHWADAVREEKQRGAAAKACAPKLRPLGFASLKDIREQLNWFELEASPYEHMQNIQPQSPWGDAASKMCPTTGNMCCSIATRAGFKSPFTSGIADSGCSISRTASKSWI